jgi:hypothetical protein
MRQDDRERGPRSAVLSSTSHFDDDAPGAVMTAEDERIAEALASGLSRLRTARPDFQQQLERRLLDRLAEPPRPWWRRVGHGRQQLRRAAPGLVRLPRRWP